MQRHFGFKTPRGAEVHLKALAAKGYLEHHPYETPAYRPKFPQGSAFVPILGRAPAGPPSDHAELFEGLLPLPWPVESDAFAIKAEGDSMIGAHIVDGDLLVIDLGRAARDRDIVLAQLDGQQTIKRLRLWRDRWELVAENPLHQTVQPGAEGDRIVGPVIALVRRV